MGVIISRQEWRHLCYLTVLDYAKFTSPILCHVNSNVSATIQWTTQNWGRAFFFFLNMPFVMSLRVFQNCLVSAGRYQQRANKSWNCEDAKYCCSKWHCYYLNYKLVGSRLHYIVMSIWRLIRQNWLDYLCAVIVFVSFIIWFVRIQSTRRAVIVVRGSLTFPKILCCALGPDIQ